MSKPKKNRSKKQSTNPGMDSLQGQFLVAMPMMSDRRFVKSVLYVVEHNGEGAMAIAIHETLPNINFGDVISDIRLGSKSKAEKREIRVSDHMASQPVLRGGPVQSSRGFVVHSHQSEDDGSSFPINSETYLSADIDVLAAMALETEPENSLFALGYCGWRSGQLEGELAQNAWLTVPFDADLLFKTAFEDRYDGALNLLGINRASLSAFSGRA